MICYYCNNESRDPIHKECAESLRNELEDWVYRNGWTRELMRNVEIYIITYLFGKYGRNLCEDI